MNIFFLKTINFKKIQIYTKLLTFDSFPTRHIQTNTNTHTQSVILYNAHNKAHSASINFKD